MTKILRLRRKPTDSFDLDRLNQTCAKRLIVRNGTMANATLDEEDKTSDSVRVLDITQAASTVE